MRRVVIESPYGGAERERNVAYAQAALADCLRRGEAPYASHLLYTQVLEDDIPRDRRIGMEAGFAWGECAELCVVYQDLGTSDGMKAGIARAQEWGIDVEYRSLKAWRELPEAVKPPPIGPRWTGVEVDAEVAAAEPAK